MVNFAGKQVPFGTVEALAAIQYPQPYLIASQGANICPLFSPKSIGQIPDMEVLGWYI
jgi:hypothetical protein